MKSNDKRRHETPSMTSKKPARRTQAERTEASDNAMYKAAIKLIAKDGFQKMTLAKVGNEAGFSRGLVTYRFGSKSGLLIATTNRILELWDSRVLSKYNSNGLRRLRDVADAYLDAVGKRSDLMMALFRLMQESYCSTAEIRSAFETFDNKARQITIDHIKIGIQDGEVLNTVDPEAFALTYIGLLRGVALQYFVSPEEVDLKIAKQAIHNYLDSLKNP